MFCERIGNVISDLQRKTKNYIRKDQLILEYLNGFFKDCEILSPLLAMAKVCC